MTPAPILTTDEYLRTPETVLPQELAYGEWKVADAPTPRHQSAVFAFGLSLDRFVRRSGLGRIYLSPVDVILDERRHLVVQPDLVFIAESRRDLVRDRIWGAPDLVLEVLSPRPRIGDLDQRLGWFAAYGVRECWLLHQDRRVLEVVPFMDGRIATSTAFIETAPIRSAVLPDWERTLAGVLAGFED